MLRGEAEILGLLLIFLCPLELAEEPPLVKLSPQANYSKYVLLKPVRNPPPGLGSVCYATAELPP